MDAPIDEPDDSIAAAIAAEVLGTPARVARFPTGSRHFVFDAIGSGGARVVVRLSRREDASLAEDSLYWSAKLRPKGVPLPEVLQADTSGTRYPFPYVVLERLPGRDLGDVVDQLSPEAQRRLVRRLAAIQATVAALPAADGFGFAPRLEGPFAHGDWGTAVAASVRRSRKRIRSAAVIGEGAADRVEAATGPLASYFTTVQPTPFLHDITTKNVIVDGERLSGIVDVDDLCFGDPLFLVALIRVALLANGHDESYADAWLETLAPDDAQRAALDVYTAVFCLDFMAELGHRFNQATAPAVDPAYLARLQRLLNRFLGA